MSRAISWLNDAVLVAAILAIPLAVRAADFPAADRGPAKNVEQVIDQPVTLEFIETPLTDLRAYLESVTGVQFHLDTRALDDVGVGTDSPLTVTLKEVPLETALDVVLAQLDLTWTVRGNLLVITTPEAAQNPSMMITRIYPVDDLKIEDPMETAQKWLRGQLNAMGLGGVNFGGMGGGMGDMGGGGMGGGMFSLQHEDTGVVAEGGAQQGSSAPAPGTAGPGNIPSVPQPYYSGDQLIDTVVSTIEPSTWDSVGGPGSIQYITVNGRGALVITQTYIVQRKIAHLLEGLRAIAQSGEGTK